MAHPPGVGYSEQGPPTPKPAAAPRTPKAASPAAPAPTPGPAPQGGDVVLPNLPSIPGGTTLEKTFLVIGILIIGLGVYSKVTGKSFSLGLSGFNAAPGMIQPAATVANAPLASTMSNRIAKVNPAAATGRAGTS